MKIGAPAIQRSLDPEVLRDLVVFRDFLAQRDRAMAELLQQNMAPSRLRDELLRLVLVEFGSGRHHRLSFYQRELSPFAGRFAVRDEVHRLAKMDVLRLENDPSDGRSIIVHPAPRLIEWCNAETPKLKIEIARLFLDSETARNG